MSDISATIEALENQLMRAWMNRQAAELRKLLSRDFLMIVGSDRPQLLDRPSFAEASKGAFACTGFRFREVFVRQHGKCAWFAAGVDLDLKLGRLEWSGPFWVTDLWCKSAIRRRWMLEERSLSRMETNAEVPPAIRDLQLWK